MEVTVASRSVMSENTRHWKGEEGREGRMEGGGREGWREGGGRGGEGGVGDEGMEERMGGGGMARNM